MLMKCITIIEQIPFGKNQSGHIFKIILREREKKKERRTAK